MSGEAMRVSVHALRQQEWRAEKLFTDMRKYAESIGCTYVMDECVCETEEQSRKLATWWTEHA
jgi:hypothetical protein